MMYLERNGCSVNKDTYILIQILNPQFLIFQDGGCVYYYYYYLNDTPSVLNYKTFYLF
jgi:hypothetical protein